VGHARNGDPTGAAHQRNGEGIIHMKIKEQSLYNRGLRDILYHRRYGSIPMHRDFVPNYGTQHDNSSYFAGETIDRPPEFQMAVRLLGKIAVLRLHWVLQLQLVYHSHPGLFIRPPQTRHYIIKKGKKKRAVMPSFFELV
jgi:hypothetical protein